MATPSLTLREVGYLFKYANERYAGKEHQHSCALGFIEGHLQAMAITGTKPDFLVDLIQSEEK